MILFYEGKIAVGRGLEEALEALFEEANGALVSPYEQRMAPQAASALEELARRAKSLYDEAVEKQRSGDWTGYGRAMEELGEVLRQMISS